MNPYTLPLNLIPGIVTFVGALIEKRKIRVLSIIIATAIYWLFLQYSVDWAYTHPFSPNDGAAGSFAGLFGWAIGLITVVIPVYCITRILKTIYKRQKK